MAFVWYCRSLCPDIYIRPDLIKWPTKANLTTTMRFRLGIKLIMSVSPTGLLGYDLNLTWIRLTWERLTWIRLTWIRLTWNTVGLSTVDMNEPTIDLNAVDLNTVDVSTVDMEYGWPEYGWPEYDWPEYDWPEYGWFEYGWPEYGWLECGWDEYDTGSTCNGCNPQSLPIYGLASPSRMHMIFWTFNGGKYQTQFFIMWK